MSKRLFLLALVLLIAASFACSSDDDDDNNGQQIDDDDNDSSTDDDDDDDDTTPDDDDDDNDNDDDTTPDDDDDDNDTADEWNYSDSTYVGSTPKIAVDSSGLLHMTYAENSTTPHYAQFDLTSKGWSHWDISSSLGGNYFPQALQVAPNDDPQIAFIDNVNNYLMYAAATTPPSFVAEEIDDVNICENFVDMRYDDQSGNMQDVVYHIYNEGDATKIWTNSGDDNYIANPRWSPDDTKILFTGMIFGQTTNAAAWYIDIDDYELHLIQSATGGSYLNAFWLNNNEVVFQYGQESGIYKCNINGSGLVPLDTPAGQSIRNPVTYPGATKIAYLRDNDDDNFKIWTINSDGSGKAQVSNSPVVEILYDWSHDGTMLLGRASGDEKVWSINLGNNAVTEIISITPTGGMQFGQFLPNNSGVIYYQPVNGDAEILVRLFEDWDTPIRITYSQELDMQADVNNAMDKMAFLSRRDRLDYKDDVFIQEFSLSELWYGYNDGTTWNTEQVDTSNSLPVSLWVDPNDKPHLFYPKNSNLVYAYKDTSWHFETAASYSSWIGNLSIVAGIGSTDVYATYCDDTDNSFYFLHKASKGWDSTDIATLMDCRGYLNGVMAMDSLYHLHVAFLNSASTVVYGFYDGAWAFEDVDSGDSSNYFIYLTIDSNNKPYIVYTKNGTLQLAYKE